MAGQRSWHDRAKATSDPASRDYNVRAGDDGWGLHGNQDGGGGQVKSVERSLRERLRAGDPWAFGELFDAHAGAVFRHGVRLTGDPGLAEEVVSGTFLQAWRIRKRLDTDGGSPLPWLLRIATNVCRNLLRTRRRQRDLAARAAAREDVPDFADEVASRIDDARTLATVRLALRSLRPAEREVIALCVWERLDYAEAARVLGVPIGTVRSRLSRARKKLATVEPHLIPRQVKGRRAGLARPAPEAKS